jgi:hypothetical protein
MAATATARVAGEAVDGSPRRPSAGPGTVAITSTGGLRTRTFGGGPAQGHRLDFDADARLIDVHLQGHVADAQGGARNEATTTLTSSITISFLDDRPRRRVIACACAADHVPPPGRLVRDTDPGPGQARHKPHR